MPAAFTAFCTSPGQIDPAFTIAFGVLFVCLFLGIIVSYVRPPRPRPPVENGIRRDSEVCKGNSEFLLDPISDSGEQCTKSIWDGHVCYLCGQFSSSSSKTRHKLYQQIPQIIFLKSPVTAAQRERERGDTLSPLSNVTDVGMMWDWPKANYPCMTCSHHYATADALVPGTPARGKASAALMQLQRR